MSRPSPWARPTPVPRGTVHHTLLEPAESRNTPACPWDCLRHHRGLFDREGEPRASWCELCDRLVSNAEWLTTPAPLRRQP